MLGGVIYNAVLRTNLYIIQQKNPRETGKGMKKMCTQGGKILNTSLIEFTVTVREMISYLEGIERDFIL